MASFVKITTEDGDEYVNMDTVLFFVEKNKSCKIHFVDGSTKGFHNTTASILLPRGHD